MPVDLTKSDALMKTRSAPGLIKPLLNRAAHLARAKKVKSVKVKAKVSIKTKE